MTCGLNLLPAPCLNGSFRKCLSAQKKAGAFERVRLAQRAIKDLGEKNLKLTCSVGPSFLKLPDSPELILKFCPPAFLGGEFKQRGLPLLGAVLPGQRWIQTSFPPGTQNRRAN
jgi:hypothetical protein